MAVALAPHVLVNCVAPGLLEGTRATANLPQAQIEQSAAAALLKKAADKDDCRRPGRHHVPHRDHDRPDRGDQLGAIFPLNPQPRPPDASELSSRGDPRRIAAMSRKAAARLPLGDDTIRPTFSRERAAMKRGVFPVAGCDEAGRGPLAGPVVAAAVILDPQAHPAAGSTIPRS